MVSEESLHVIALLLGPAEDNALLVLHFECLNGPQHIDALEDLRAQRDRVFVVQAWLDLVMLMHVVVL